MVKEGKNLEYELNNYRFENIDDKILVTTDHGSWDFFTKNEFNSLRNESFIEDPILFNKLENKGIILTKKNKNEVIKKFRNRFNNISKGTSLHIIIPTLRCNQKCVYCHASSKPLNKKGFDMDEKTAKSVVDFIFQSPSSAITIEFQGGEPLLNFEIIKYIIEYANEKNKDIKKELLFNLVSNFSLMDENKLNFFINNKISLCTSIDGPESLHNYNRGYLGESGSFEFAKKWILRLKDQYKKQKIYDRKPNALITITKESLKYPHEIIDEYKNIGLTEFHLRFLNNLGDARTVWNKIGYTPYEFIDFWKKSLDYLIDLNKKGIKLKERTAVIILQKILTENDPNYLDLRSPCGAGIGQMTYTYDGEIFSCDEARMIGNDLFKLGNVKNDNYKTVISSNKTCSLVSSSVNDCQICDYCVFKPYCGICPVCNFAELGSIIAKIPETSRCKIYKAQFSYIFNKLQDPEINKILLNWI